MSDFSSSGVSYLNLADTNTNLKGFFDDFSDGTFAYFVPYHNGDAHSGYVACVSLSDFSSSGVTYLNLADTNTNLKLGFYGGFTDGTFAYFVPSGMNAYGYVARVSLSDFSSSGVSFLNLADTNTNLKGFYGGFTDGTFAYFVPRYNGAAHSGYVARVSLSDFSSSGVSFLNLADTNTNLINFAGGFTNGTFGYFVCACRRQ